MAVIIEEQMRAWMAANSPVRERAVRQGVERFFAALGAAGQPATAEVNRASAAAREAVFAALTADAVLDTLPNPPPDAGAREALRSSLLSVSPPLDLAAPPAGRALSSRRVAAAAAAGALLGLFVLGTLLRWTLGLGSVGMLLGAPAGAAAAVLGIGRLADNPALRRTLTTVVGVAGTVDLVGTAALGLSGIWFRLAGLGLLRRVLVYAGVVALLAFTRGSAQYDAQTYRDSVAERIRHWVDCASLLLCGLAAGGVAQPLARPEHLDADLAKAIQDLHGSDLAALPAAAEAVLLEAHRVGLQGLAGAARFTESVAAERARLRWRPELAEQYLTFGLVEEGDTVIVEDDPVVQNGVVLEKGRVRKQRS